MAIAACIEQKVDFLFIMLQLCNHSHVIAVCVYIWHTLPVSSQMQGYCFLYKDVIGSSVRLSSEPKMNAKWPFFLIKLHSCVRKSATNFLCVKTVGDNVVRHSWPNYQCENDWWVRPLLPEILDQGDRVGAKSPNFDLFSLVALKKFLSVKIVSESCKAFIVLTIRAKMIGGGRPLKRIFCIK